MNKNSFGYYQYEIGRYSKEEWVCSEPFKPYKPETKKLVWNVFDYDFSSSKIRPINLFEYNWVFLEEGLLYAKKHYANDYEKFAGHIRSWLQHEYWSRVQYETIITGVFDNSNEYKMDVYTQVMMNWDRFIDYVWNNKNLITKKKLGL